MLIYLLSFLHFCSYESDCLNKRLLVNWIHIWWMPCRWIYHQVLLSWILNKLIYFFLNIATMLFLIEDNHTWINLIIWLFLLYLFLFFLSMTIYYKILSRLCISLLCCNPFICYISHCLLNALFNHLKIQLTEVKLFF